MNQAALKKSLNYIDSWLTFRYKYSGYPGYTVAIAHKGEVIFNKAYGYANLETNTQLTPAHIFRIASHSKTFTATSLMQLQEAGKLRIDDPVVDYVPWLKDHKDKRWQKVTLRQLMSHGAGMIRDGLDSDYWQLERPFPSSEEFKQEVLEADLVLDNNIKLKYSNFGYGLLGLVIEAASGQTYHQYVTQHIIQPLGLKNTGPEYRDAIKNKIVTGYTYQDVDKNRLPFDQIDTRALASATGFYSNTEDLCKYFTAQMVGSGELLGDESKKEMRRIHFHAYTPGSSAHQDYGLGFELESLGKRRIYGHGGGFPGQTTQSSVDEKNELVVIVLTNSLGGPESMITSGVFNIIDYYQQNMPTTKPKHDLSMFEGRYRSIWDTIDVVVLGDKVVVDYPAWRPLSNTNELVRIDDTTFRIPETNSFDSEGEFIKFNIKNGKVETLNKSGTTMWPEDVWEKRQASRKIIKVEP